MVLRKLPSLAVNMIYLGVAALVGVTLFLYWIIERIVCGHQMVDRQSDKVVLVVGCESGGIGRQVARLLDDRGVPVFAGCRDETSALQLRGISSPKLRTLVLDTTSSKSVQAAVDFVERHLPPSAVLWGVVNTEVESRAAGLPAEMYTIVDDYRPLLENNLLSAVTVASAFMPLLMSSQGRVVNTGCLTGLVDVPTNAAYGASMAALVSWSEALRREKASGGLTVSLVIPGAVDKSDEQLRIIWKQLSSRWFSAPKHVRNLYGRQYADNVGLAIWRTSRMTAQSTEIVARAYAHALFARRPRRMYLVGSDAHLAAFIGCLPRCVQDRLLPYFFYHPRLPSSHAAQGLPTPE